jgi:hypothetical protein
VCISVSYAVQDKNVDIEWRKSLSKDFLRAQAIRALEENVEENSRLDRWLVYEHYEIISDEAGNRFIHAPPHTKDAPNEYRRSHPLSRTSAECFLRFAHWPEETGMDKELDTQTNAKAAKSWAETYGVLGLNPLDPFITDMVNSRRVTADYLGVPELSDASFARGRHNYARGGPPEESIANFAFEAWEAHITWRLYESVRKETVDADSIVQFMSAINQWEADISVGPLADQPWVERDIYSRDPELARRWALIVVGDAVNRKIENYCYPIIRGDAPGSYEPGWVFNSLLGAMWLQMMFLMVEDRRCWWCDKPLDPGRRSHARFCDNDGQCRANWNYNKGEGKSSKRARRDARYIR